MIETFTALLFAHCLADFVLQTGWIVENKRRLLVLLLHIAIVWATAAAALGTVTALPLVYLAVAHLVIDATKTYGRFEGVGAFLLDQAAHIATLIVIAVLYPALWGSGPWAVQTSLPALMALLSGLIFAVTAGMYAIGLLMQPYGFLFRSSGLKNGGRLIGIMERGLIFLFILQGQATAVGLLIAAKSILRFGTPSKDQRSAEYVIIGTLASFGWAILIAYATRGLLGLLPALEIRTLIS